ncbi:SDR family NAD(P)-dependent oxidoreductase [Pseudomonadota bacterium]
MSKSSQKTAIITGSSKGIGLAIAQELASQDYAVIVTSRDPDYADEIAQGIKNTGGTALGISFDIEQPEVIEPLIQTTVDTFGRLDLLVNNALSQNCLVPLPACDRTMIESAFTTNITNTLALTQAAYPYLKNTQGNVINIGSVVISRHLLGLPLYAIIKGAIDQMTKVLASEWAADQVRVNAINPGFIETSAFADLGMPDEQIKQAYEFYKGYSPLGKTGQPDAIGKLAAYLASPGAELITGSTYDIDGGYNVQGLPLFGADQ